MLKKFHRNIVPLLSAHFSSETHIQGILLVRTRNSEQLMCKITLQGLFGSELQGCSNDGGGDNVVLE